MSSRTVQGPSGWMIFAITMLFVAGFMNAVYGLAMIFNSDWIVFTAEGALFLSVAWWGWTTLLAGIAQLAAALGVLAGKTWGRVAGIVIAALAAGNAMFTMVIYPLWGMAIVVAAIIVIYALAVHGE